MAEIQNHRSIDLGKSAQAPHLPLARPARLTCRLRGFLAAGATGAVMLDGSMGSGSKGCGVIGCNGLIGAGSSKTSAIGPKLHIHAWHVRVHSITGISAA